MKYTYKFRPGYGSNDYLIEINNAEQFDRAVIDVFFNAIEKVSPLITKQPKIELLLTDFNAGNVAAAMPSTHHHLYQWGPGMNPFEYGEHIPGVYKP